MSKVCLCRGITEEQIVEAVKNGATSFEEVKEATGAGAGGCRGGRCKVIKEDNFRVKFQLRVILFLYNH